MVKITKQMRNWMNCFGKDYTRRNNFNLREFNRSYKNTFGLSRIELNNLFIGKLNRNIKILEVGSNCGLQLLLLQRMGFKNLYGIEINKYAVEASRSRTKNIHIIQGSAFDIPFKDEYFDLAFTSGVLIHISPSDIKMAIKEICRCSKEYIWGFEYYADTYRRVDYRGHQDLLWKTDFPKLYCTIFKNLKLVKVKKLLRLDSDNTDIMFLLKKGVLKSWPCKKKVK